jgi:hypothetical protein
MTQMHAYADESGTFNRQHQSIGVVSGSAESLRPLREDLVKVLSLNRLSEIKFEDVRTHSSKIDAANQFISKAIELIAQKAINIDVLCWDTRDKRHDIEGRDDVSNLARMYYKVFRLIAQRWGETDWTIFPDSGSNLPWADIKGYLNNTRLRPKPILLALSEEDKGFPNFRDIIPRESVEEPLIQLADLFAGMTCFSIENVANFTKWLRAKHQDDHPSLFEIGSEHGLSKTNCNRLELAHRAYLLAKSYRLGVSLASHGHLKTFNKRCPLNFWHYKPVSKHDKAPTRNRGGH